MWVYIQVRGIGGDALWTTGFYDPTGTFITDDDFEDRDQARRRVNYLNGGSSLAISYLQDSLTDIKDELIRLRPGNNDLRKY